MLAILESQASEAPHLSGKLEVDLRRGEIQGDFCSTRLTPNTPVRFTLNKGLNIESVRSASGAVLPYGGYYDPKTIGDGLEYTVEPGGGSSVCVRYVGQFPVYLTATNTFDFKGMIAINRQSLRATEQSKWYPILIDANGLEHASVTYDVEVQCASCRALYVNGDTVKRGPQARFSSALPRPLFLFIGTYGYRQLGALTYINGNTPGR